MRIILLSTLAVLVLTLAMVGINMYHNPSLTIASIKGAAQAFSAEAESAVVNSKTKVATDRSSKPQPTRNLNLTIKGTRNQRGQIIVQIYDDPKAFNTLQYDQALHTLVVPLKGFNGHINFADLTPGSYAVSLMHDENQNQLFDTQGNFLEGYAYSNNVGKTKTATFAQAQFDIKQVNKKLVLNMIYH